MKTRNGFVSNSSSSSFVLAYNKDSVITDPQKIVDYIDNHPRGEIMFINEDFSDGDDIFYLDTHQKNYLLKHRKRFVKYNTGNKTITDYSADVPEDEPYPKKTVPYVTAITETYRFNQDPNEYKRFEVDMSDIPESDATAEDHLAVMNKTATEDQIKRVNEANERCNIQYRREREAYRVAEKQYLDEVRDLVLKCGANPDTLEVKYVSVDYRSCDPDGSYDDEFPLRYFGIEEDDNDYYEKGVDPELDIEEEEEE